MAAVHFAFANSYLTESEKYEVLQISKLGLE